MLEPGQPGASAIVSTNDLQTLWATQDNPVGDINLPIRRGWPGDLTCSLTPVGTGATPLIFANAGRADQLPILAINHSHAVASVAIPKRQASHPSAGGVMRGLAVVSAVVRPSLLDHWNGTNTTRNCEATTARRLGCS